MTLAFRPCNACWDSTSLQLTVTAAQRVSRHLPLADCEWVATANKAAPGEIESNEGSLLA